MLRPPAPGATEESMNTLASILWSPVAMVLLVGAACAWARRGGRPTAAVPWRWAMDAPLAVLAGVGFAGVAAFMLAPLHVLGADYIDVDLAIYCAGLDAVRTGDVAAYPGKLSLLVGGMLSTPASAAGVLPTLTWGAVVAGGVLGTGLFTWSRLVAGRVAGLTTVLLAAANHHLVLLTRNPSFYPETTALLVLSMAFVAAAVQLRTPRALVLGGCGVGLVLATDNRFLVMGLWSACVLLLAALPGPARRLPLRLTLITAPVVASWWLSALAYDAFLAPGAYATGTLGEVSAFLRDVPGYPPGARSFEELMKVDHAWGRDSLTRIPGVVRAIAEMTARVPPERALDPEVVAGRRCVDPWLLPCAAAGLAGLVAMRRERWLLLAGPALVVPFVANLAFVSATLPQPRVLAVGMVAVPVILGIGIGAAGGQWGRWPAAALLCGLAACVAGIAPSFLSPWAAWRSPECGVPRVAAIRAAALQPGSADEVLRDLRTDPMIPRCLAAVARDASTGWDRPAFSDVRTDTCAATAPPQPWAVVEPTSPSGP